MVKIYHNTRCSKSRSACSILGERGIETTLIDYLNNPLNEDEIKELLKMLDMKAEDLVRKGEPVYKEKFKNGKFSEEEWVKILSENPILIERPIIVKGNKAVIGRSHEKLMELFNSIPQRSA